MIYPVIITGGSGTRLWPLSRTGYPKPFAEVDESNHSLLQNTLLRAQLVTDAKPIIVGSEQHRFIIQEHADTISVDLQKIILEPVSRNTAPAIVLAALYVLSLGEDPTLLILPADHLIQDLASFKKAVQNAEVFSARGEFVTFGCVPTQAHTGYGYIQKGEAMFAGNSSTAYKVQQFVEKPTKAIAEHYLQDGGYCWNSGMFMFKASTFIQAMKQFSPAILNACQQAMQMATEDSVFLRPGESFEHCPSDSIDYAVMEKVDNSVVVPIAIGWNDIGSWNSYADAQRNKDSHGNIVLGDVECVNTTNTFISASNRLVATVGIKNCIIVETKDSVLVADRDTCEDVKKLVNQLAAKGRSETDFHHRVYRPWGHYENLEEGPGFLVKRISVKPGASLSLQMHRHRSEHWIVVSGTATVTKGDEQFELQANQSTYIPVGVKHRLTNLTKEKLLLIEVQSGEIVSEADIIRFEDVYGRVQAALHLVAEAV